MAIPDPRQAAGVTRRSPDVRQYQTHLQLLTCTSVRRDASLDAIIVPAARQAPNLDHAVTLARALGCWLVVLCSLKARANEVNDLLALRNFKQAIVVDIDDGYTHPALAFATSNRDAMGLPWELVSPNGDLSTKRNLGLLLARMLGWERIFFLDDDIRDLDASDLREAGSMLGPYHVVGMRAVDFPDNSVVCHGHRKTGGYQDVFISGSALAVHCAGSVAFFPEIYNEDWFFFYHAAAAKRLGQHRRDATQLWYDPFADPQRAAGQEFGDVMAEGLYSLLHHRTGADHATSDYWRSFLKSRMTFLQAVLDRSEAVEPYLRQRIVASIKMAQVCARLIQPSACERYISLWRQDLRAWDRTLAETPRLTSVKAALDALGLTPSKPNLYVLAGLIDDTGNRYGCKGASAAGPAGPARLISSYLTPIAAPAAGPFTALNAASADREGIAPAKGVISRIGKRAGELAVRTRMAREPGRHRKVAPVSYVSPADEAESAYVGQEAFSY